MSHQINDMVKENLSERFGDMTLNQFEDWLESRKDVSTDAYTVYKRLIYLRMKWVQEKFDSLPDS